MEGKRSDVNIAKAEPWNPRRVYGDECWVTSQIQASASPAVRRYPGLAKQPSVSPSLVLNPDDEIKSGARFFLVTVTRKRGTAYVSALSGSINA